MDIQGLRAVAVTLVVLSHAGVRQFSGGYVGVDIFFVISGFLITSLLLREISTTDGISIGKFYARRALRLLPASTLVIVTTLAGTWLFLSKVRFAEYVNDALTSALYSVNFRLAITGTDYLAQDSPPSPFQHFWSLAVEEQFYVLWPLLLLLTWKLARRRVVLAMPLVVLCVVSFWWNIETTRTSASWSYFGSQSRFWELAVGALLALVAGRLNKLPSWISALMSWGGLACILLAAVRFDESTPFPGYRAALPVLGAALVLAGGISPVVYGARWVLARKPLTWLGGLSYGWYLWHWPLLVIGPAALGRRSSVRLELVLAAVGLLLAWATLHLVENPVRFHRVFRGRPRRALVLGAGLSAGAVTLALTAGTFPPSVHYGPSAPVLKNVLASAPDPGARLAQLLKTGSKKLPGNLSPAADKIKGVKSAVYKDGCHLSYTSTETPPCVYGDPTSDKVVVLFGDSHAAQWFPTMDLIAKKNRWKLISLTKASCKIASVTIISNGKPYTSCDEWQKNVISKIKEIRPSLVIVSSSEAGDPVRPMRDPLQGWTEGFQNTFQQIAGSGAKIATILDTPWPKGDPVDCAADYPLVLDNCVNQVHKAIQDPVRRNALRHAARASGVSVIDPEPWLCTPAGNCPVAVGNTMVYRDDSHMAEGYAAAIAPVLAPRLTELVR